VIINHMLLWCWPWSVPTGERFQRHKHSSAVDSVSGARSALRGLLATGCAAVVPPSPPPWRHTRHPSPKPSRAPSSPGGSWACTSRAPSFTSKGCHDAAAIAQFTQAQPGDVSVGAGCGPVALLERLLVLAQGTVRLLTLRHPVRPGPLRVCGGPWREGVAGPPGRPHHRPARRLSATACPTPGTAMAMPSSQPSATRRPNPRRRCRCSRD